LQQSVVTLEVKPWDDETDMEALEKSVRSVQKVGLVWGASKLVAVGFGIKKLQITLVVGSSKFCLHRCFFRRFIQFIVLLEDELISLDELQENIAEFEDYVQSTDVAAMQSMQDVYPIVVRLTDVSRALDWICLGGNVDVCLLGKEVEHVINVIVRQRCDVDITSNCFAMIQWGENRVSLARRGGTSHETLVLQAVYGDLNKSRPTCRESLVVARGLGDVHVNPDQWDKVSFTMFNGESNAVF
jgi:translation elongation factor EF-1beta